MIESFKGYSFCKAHSASYTQVSFESAYLRRHYPAEFMAAVLSNGGGFYSTSAYISECLRMKLKFYPIDINESEYKYEGFDDIIKIGFQAIKGLNRDGIKNVVEERNLKGEFKSLYDYLSRTRLSFSDNKLLNCLNAFKEICQYNTTQTYWLISQFYLNRRDPYQQVLFLQEEPEPPNFQEKIDLEQWMDHYELCGYLLNDHPFVLWEERIKAMNISYVPACEIKRYVGKVITVLGFPITQKTARTKNDEYMSFYSFEDQNTLYDVTLFPREYEKYRDEIVSKTPCLINGLVESEFDVETITLKWLKKVSVC